MPSEANTQGGPVNPGWFAVALQVLVFLNHTQGQVCPSATIADGLRAHAVFLRRIVAYLVRAGIVDAHEGRGGGYKLARPAEQIILADVYRALQATGTGTLLPIEPERGPQLAPGLRLAFKELGDEFTACILDVLSKRTLADLTRQAEALSDTKTSYP